MIGYNILNLLSLFKYQAEKIKKTPRYLLTKRVETYLQKPCPNLDENDRKQFLKFLQYHLVSVFNYPYMVKYRRRKVKVLSDEERGLPFVLTEKGHRLYFKKGMRKGEIASLYNSLCAEQDDLSPHNYDFDKLTITDETVFADIGSAEGNFSLKYVDEIKKLYLFETDAEWIEALEATFYPWKDKVTIVNKYVSDRDEGEYISLDTYFLNREKPTLLKLDVEGAEKSVLSGANQTLNDGIDDILLCTYHRNGDTQYFSEWLRNRNYDIRTSNGYMLYLWEKPNYSLEPPFDFRRGLIHARLKSLKNENKNKKSED
ncbi:MAG: FkbM family methyltransferase [Prevotellaceae bacterium]|jgi:hypothetical protein|nr:FkbM family methyltransferase [Prevotellaceae bacterium]